MSLNHINSAVFGPSPSPLRYTDIVQAVFPNVPQEYLFSTFDTDVRPISGKQALFDSRILLKFPDLENVVVRWSRVHVTLCAHFSQGTMLLVCFADVEFCYSICSSPR
jgi:hypothetical protein